LKQLIMKKSAKMYKDILSWFDSVAYGEKETRTNNTEGSPCIGENDLCSIPTTEVIQKSQ
jgi:hypothetical protein